VGLKRLQSLLHAVDSSSVVPVVSQFFPEIVDLRPPSPHANLLPITAVVDTARAVAVVLPLPPYTLEQA